MLLLACFLFGQTYVTIHHALVAHHVCEQGGELVHGEHPGHGGHGHAHLDAHELRFEAAFDHRVEPHKPQEPTGPRWVAGEAGPGHGEHCTIPTSRSPRRVAPIPPSPGGGALELVDRGTPIRREVVALGGVPLFRLAPKQSPPSRARI